jgi:hypothetical protein
MLAGTPLMNLTTQRPAARRIPRTQTVMTLIMTGCPMGVEDQDTTISKV